MSLTIAQLCCMLFGFASNIVVASYYIAPNSDHQPKIWQTYFIGITAMIEILVLGFIFQALWIDRSWCVTPDARCTWRVFSGIVPPFHFLFIAATLPPTALNQLYWSTSLPLFWFTALVWWTTGFINYIHLGLVLQENHSPPRMQLTISFPSTPQTPIYYFPSSSSTSPTPRIPFTPSSSIGVSIAVVYPQYSPSPSPLPSPSIHSCPSSTLPGQVPSLILPPPPPYYSSSHLVVESIV